VWPYRIITQKSDDELVSRSKEWQGGLDLPSEWFPTQEENDRVD